MSYDLNQPLPDAAHEALRVAVLAAISDLGNTGTDVSGNFFLADTQIELVADLLNRVAALEDRVALLDGGLGAPL